jgi:hypothetical protein
LTKLLFYQSIKIIYLLITKLQSITAKISANEKNRHLTLKVKVIYGRRLMLVYSTVNSCPKCCVVAKYEDNTPINKKSYRQGTRLRTAMAPATATPT